MSIIAYKSSKITQKQIAEKINKSERTVKRIVEELKKNGKNKGLAVQKFFFRHQAFYIGWRKRKPGFLWGLFFFATKRFI